MGYRWGQKEGQDLGKWNLHEVDGETGKAIKPQLTFLKNSDAVIRTSAAASATVFRTTP